MEKLFRSVSSITHRQTNRNWNYNTLEPRSSKLFLIRTRFAPKEDNPLQELSSTINDAAGEKLIEFQEQLSLKNCCYMAAYVWLGVKRVTLKRTWRELLYYIEDEEDTIKEEMEDDITTDVKEILPALNIILRFDDCDNADGIEWFP